MDEIIKAFKGKRVLITGGGGYLGSELAGRLAKYGIEIILLDKTFNSVSQLLSKDYTAVNLFKSDLLNQKELSLLCNSYQPDYVYHFAALTDRSRDFSIYQMMYEVNVRGTLNLLEALLPLTQTVLFFSSSAEVYGNKNHLPFDEDQQPEPASPYSLTKTFGEQLIRTYSAIHNKRFIIFRIFNFYGIGMPEDTFIPQLVKASKEGEVFKMSKGEQKRDYLLINDLLYYLINFAGIEKAYGETINICSGNSVSMSDIAEFVKEKSGNTLEISKTLPYRTNEIWDIRGKDKKIKSFFPDYKPKSILEGL